MHARAALREGAAGKGNLLASTSPRFAVLEREGVAAVFGPGTNIPAAARKVLQLIRARRLDHAAE